MSSFCQECKGQNLSDTYKNLSEDDPVTEETATQAMKEVLNAMGVDSCRTTYSDIVGQKRQKHQQATLWGGSYKRDNSDVAIGKKTTSIGCEEIVAIAKKYNYAKRSIVNILSCSCASTKVDISLRNKLKIRLRRVRCRDGIKSIQTIMSNVNMVQSVSSAQQNEIASVVQQFLKDTSDTLQTSIQDALPSGEKTMMMDTKNINDEMINNATQNTMAEMNFSAMGNNVLEIDIEDTDVGGVCEFSQNIVIDIIAKNVLESAMGNIIKSANLSDVISETIMTKEEKHDVNKFKGASDWQLGMNAGEAAVSIVGGIACVIFILVVLYVVMTIMDKKKGN